MVAEAAVELGRQQREVAAAAEGRAMITPKNKQQRVPPARASQLSGVDVMGTCLPGEIRGLLREKKKKKKPKKTAEAGLASHQGTAAVRTGGATAER